VRPLDGLTVVALEQAVAAPFATRQLADLGARVIKIERPGVGDFARAYDESVHGQSSHFVWLNRSKESLTLDISGPAGREILHRLLDRADVFVQNLAPDAIGRLGLTTANLRERYPQLLVCNISGYGSDGPWATRKAYDLLIQCETGVVSLTGPPSTPSRVGISIADIAGGMYAYSGILTALYQRAATGVVSAVDVSLFDALAEWMGYPVYYTGYGGSAPARAGLAHPTIAPYGPFPTGDGATVMVAVQNEREWAAFCAQVLDRPDLTDEPRFAGNPARVRHRDALDALITERFAGLPAVAVLDRLDAARIANARVNSVEEFVAHPLLTERDRWRDVATPGGPVRALLPPVALSDATPRMDPVPALGAHTTSILTELNYPADTVSELRRAGVV
jgi:crotonobetainyl-CoA:carnitine CoA-transferase CaiB-like acyl-CoA transferase